MQLISTDEWMRIKSIEKPECSAETVDCIGEECFCLHTIWIVLCFYWLWRNPVTCKLCCGGWSKAAPATFVQTHFIIHIHVWERRMTLSYIRHGKYVRCAKSLFAQVRKFFHLFSRLFTRASFGAVKNLRVSYTILQEFHKYRAESMRVCFEFHYSLLCFSKLTNEKWTKGNVLN